MSEIDTTTPPATTDVYAETVSALESSPGRIAAPTTDDVAAFAAPVSDTRYEPIDVIGRGGMGEVRRWRDRRVGRDLAVKVAHATLGPEGRRRFAREALLQARLEHPAFVPVYDVASDAKGELYFTMRKVRGRTLRAVLLAEKDGRERLLRHRLLAVFNQLCLAIDFAHSRGVVHRDVKPENVMLGDFGEVYLLDWGIAKILDEAEEDAASLRSFGPDRVSATAHGSMLGTPGYMAPEQLRGENSTLDGRADVYALGAVLFEILTLEPMNRGGTFADLIAATLEGSGRSPAERCPARDIAPELDAIVVKATAPTPPQRYQSARDLADAVERYLEGDRDLASRRAKAATLAASASASLESASGDPEKRADAGRQAARAIAFDPEQADARKVLLSVLGEAPAVPPPAVLEAVERRRQNTESQGLESFARTSLVIKVMLIVLFWALGSLARGPVIAALGAGILGALIAMREARRGAPSDRWVTIGFLFTCVENAAFMRATSPFVAVPLAIVATIVGVTVHAPAKRRAERVALGALAMIVPVLLEWTGVLAPTWTEHGAVVTITSRMMDVAVPGWFVAVHGLMIMVGQALSLYPRLDDARAADIRVQSNAWMLRRVLDSA